MSDLKDDKKEAPAVFANVNKPPKKKRTKTWLIPVSCVVAFLILGQFFWNQHTSKTSPATPNTNHRFAENRDISAIEMNLSSMEISSENLAKMIKKREIPANIINLYLYENEISDLRPLAELSNLKELYLSGNPLSQTQIDELQNSLPNCEILFDS